MGRDKSRVLLGFVTLLDHVRFTALATGLPVRVVRHDLIAGLGPLGGFHTALASTRARAVMFLACDMPLITPALAGSLDSIFALTGRAVFTRHGAKVGYPLLLPRHHLKAVLDSLQGRDRSLQALFTRLNGVDVAVAVTRRHELSNVNSPRDLDRVRRLWFRMRSLQRSSEFRIRPPGRREAACHAPR